MNKVFKVIWNEARNAYVVVSEIAKNHGSKSCSTKKLLAMLIATGVMTCASFDVLADEPSAAQTAQSQYVAFAPTTSSFPDEYEQTIDGHKYIYDVANQYWVREGYILVLEQNAKLHTPLSTNGRAADVAYTGGGDTSRILQSVTSLVSASGTVTNMGESLNSINASAYAAVSHSGGTKVAGTWNYIIEDSSWKDSVAPGNYKYGYVDLVDSKLPKGFKTAEDPNTELTWNDTKQCYTYKGNPVDYSNIYVIDGKIGVFTNKDGSKVYTGNVFGKNNEVLMTVKDADNKFYSYWASEVTDPSATMQSYRMADYEKDLSVLLENEKKLYRNDIKEVTLTKDENSATISLLRNGDTEAGAPVTGAITVTSGGGTEGSDTFVKISNGTANQTFATGSKVEVNGPADAITGIKVNGVDYTIKQGSGVKVEQDAANKTTTITVDGNATTITDTDTTYTAGDGIEINGGNAISVSKNLIGMESIQGAGEGKISFDGDNVKVNNTTFGENSVVVGVAGDGKHPVRIDGETGRITGLANTKVGYTDFANDKGTAATEGQLKQVMDEGWKFTTDSNEKTTVKVGPDGTNDNAVTFKGDGTNIAVTNTGKDIKVALKKDLTVDSVKVGDKTYISDKGLNANDQKVTNVAAGELSETSKDAVNGSQLYKTNQEVVNNTNRINKLGSRVNKVGAGAAALAALHPMDFDPDDKLTFSAGYGNYAGENAAAIGAYYRPDEKVMFSVAGTVGNGENMVNAGVSFALDRTNHVSNSRTALAREVIDLRGQLAVMGAKMAKMEKAFGMLDETKTKLFPDVPANHWAYEYIAKLAGNGYIEGYPDGNFGGDRLMTRYEFAAMLYRAIENGAALEEKIIKEFEPELGRIRVDRISGEDGDRDKIERVRVNDTKGERDHYGNKLAK